MPRYSVTPQRRSRSRDDEDDDDDEELRLTPDEGTASSRRNKRQRREVRNSSGEEEEEEEKEEEEEGEMEQPLLPDNYRRSPKGKGPAQNGLLQRSDEPQEHQPGSIVRVRLKDFVTYTAAEFHPGPNLNMIIGPNGTGKSTLVCAICIGLGWSTSHLGRAKDISEFVKHGRKRAEIEIELKADPTRHTQNPVILHVINKDGGSRSGSTKSIFAINGKKSTNKAVQEFAKSFHIQVDNLCQFLPQDRVVEFAALSPVDLLVSTQRAAAPAYMSDWHEELKKLCKEQKQKQIDQQTLTEDLKSKQDRQRAQQDRVDQMRERGALQEKIALLEKLKPFAVYNGVKAELLETRSRKKEAGKELKRLERRLQPNLKAADAKQRYHAQLSKYVKHRQNLLSRAEKAADTKLKEVEDLANKAERCNVEMDNHKLKVRETKNASRVLHRGIRELEQLQRNPPTEVDFPAMNEELRQIGAQLRTVEHDMTVVANEIKAHQESVNQREKIIDQESERRANLHSQAGRQTSKLANANRDVARAWSWVQNNRNKFKGDVYGPVMVECSVRDARHVQAVESVIGRNDLMAITATTDEDFKMLRTELQNQQLSIVSLRQSPSRSLSEFRSSCSAEELRRQGADAWLLDLIDGPDALLAMLCETSGLDRTVYSNRSGLDDAQLETLKRSPVLAFVTATKSWRVTSRSDYGNASSTLVSLHKPARFLGDAPVDTQEEEVIRRRIDQRTSEINEIKAEMRGMQQRLQELRTEQARVKTKFDALKSDKETKQKQKTEFEGLGAKLTSHQDKLAQRKEELDSLIQASEEIIEVQEAHLIQRGQAALDLAKLIDQIRNLQSLLFEFEIMRIEAQSDCEQLQLRHEEELNTLEQSRLEIQRLQQEESALLQRGNELGAQCREVGDALTHAETIQYEELLSEGRLHSEELEMDIQRVEAQLALIHGGNERVVKEFDDRQRYIEQKRDQLNALEQALEDIATKIAEIRRQWEPQLDQVVGQISAAFAENFSRIRCAGEVAVYKDDDFEQWAIQIQVKFRENEQLNILDAHRQSGGERAVSTIFYLMALQSLATAPFRVVDEINQGMDPRNERLVHSRMVEIACQERTCQYFLITPKLLNNLTYHKNMKVHCIASGEYMPEKYQKLDFSMLAKKALAIRAAAT